MADETPTMFFDLPEVATPDDEETHDLLNPPALPYSRVTINEATFTWKHLGYVNDYDDVCRYFHYLEVAGITITSSSQQQVYDRYFEQVTRRDFLRSYFLQQRARKRYITPHQLWVNFSMYIMMHNLDSTMTNLVDYLDLTSNEEHDYDHRDFNNQTPDLVSENQNNYQTDYSTDINSFQQAHQELATVNGFQTYTGINNYVFNAAEATNIHGYYNYQTPAQVFVHENNYQTNFSTDHKSLDEIFAILGFETYTGFANNVSNAVAPTYNYGYYNYTTPVQVCVDQNNDQTSYSTDSQSFEEDQNNDQTSYSTANQSFEEDQNNDQTSYFTDNQSFEEDQTNDQTSYSTDNQSFEETHKKPSTVNVFETYTWIDKNNHRTPDQIWAYDINDQTDYSTNDLSPEETLIEPLKGHVFKTYTNADFLKIKKDAEDAFAKECEEKDIEADIEIKDQETIRQVDALVAD